MTGKKNNNALEVTFLGRPFKTLAYVQQNLPGRFNNRPVTLKTLYKYLNRGMPHFEWGGRIMFSDKDLAEIPDWIAENCRGGRNKRASL